MEIYKKENLKISEEFLPFHDFLNYCRACFSSTVDESFLYFQSNWRDTLAVSADTVVMCKNYKIGDKGCN